jgi:hypothetical protein
MALRRLFFIVGSMMGALCIGAVVWAYFTSTGSGSGSAVVGTFTATTVATPSVTVTVTSGSSAPTVDVSWGAVTPPAFGTVSYYVQRWNGSTPGDVCGTTTSTHITDTHCYDTSVPAGTYTYTVTAYWQSWSATSANSSPVTVLATTTTSLASSANPSVTGQSVTYTATVTGSPGTPTGSVLFYDGASIITCSGGDQTLNGSSPDTATCQVSYSSIIGSPHSITAVYDGDGTFYGSTSSALSQTVNPDLTTTTVSSSPISPVSGQETVFTASVAAESPGSGTPTGTATFTITDASSKTYTCQGGNNTLSLSSGSVSCTLVGSDVLAADSPHTVHVVYNGDSNYLTSSTSPDLSVTVNKDSTTTSVESSLSPSVTGQSVTFTASVAANSPGSGTPTGTATFTIEDASNNPVSCSTTNSPTLSSGQATCTVPSALMASASPYTVSVSYGGDTNYSTSSGSPSGNQVVNKDTTSSTLLASPTIPVTGQETVFTASVTADSPGSGTPTGTATFTITPNGGGSVSCNTTNSPTLSGGQAACTVPSLLASESPYTVHVVYSGDDDYITSSTSPDLLQTVDVASTTASVSSVFDSSLAGQQVTYTASVSVNSPGLGTPTGYIEFFDSGTPISTCGGSSGLVLGTTCEVTYDAMGSHTITAQYLGDANFSASSASSSITQVVNEASPTLSVSRPSGDIPGVAISASSISAALGSSSGSNASGTITFTVFGPGSYPTTCTSGGATVGTATVNSGNATYNPNNTYMPTSSGEYWWYASYSGDSNNNVVTSTCGSGMSETDVEEGNWVGTYGSSGYILGGWNGTSDANSSDLSSLPSGITYGASFVPGTAATRYQWADPTTDPRALESPDTMHREATCWYDNSSFTLTLTLSFSSTFSGNLELYAVDWDSKGRNETITVTDSYGSYPVTIGPFVNGAWVVSPINVSSGGSVTINVVHNAGDNAVLSGVFLDQDVT